jgi:hypothetical protein
MNSFENQVGIALRLKAWKLTWYLQGGKYSSRRYGQASTSALTKFLIALPGIVSLLIKKQIQ